MQCLLQLVISCVSQSLQQTALGQRSGCNPNLFKSRSGEPVSELMHEGEMRKCYELQSVLDLCLSFV